MDDHHLAAADDGRRLAPVPRLLQHLVQAARRRPHLASARCSRSRSAAQPLDFENIEDLDEDAALGVGKVEDFTWKGLLDFTTCTECGRCQSQCPAWNTDKPLSPKLLVMALRDHAHAKAPWLLAAEEDARRRHRRRDGCQGDAAEVAVADRALIGGPATTSTTR